ncbi:MAG: FG-GAP-like repeat-containing protein [Chloroflexota bacterium]
MKAKVKLFRIVLCVSVALLILPIQPSYSHIAQLLTPLGLINHSPEVNEVGVAPTSNVTATFDANVAAGSVTSQSFAAHTQFGGLLTGTLSVAGDTITLNPNRDLFAGEQVQVITTSDISSTDGGQLTNPTQWGFTAGPVSNRCTGDFIEAGVADDMLAAVSNGSVAWGDYDNDGDLDILLTGEDATKVAKVYRNDAGIFTELGIEDNALIPVSNSAAAWGDYDNDGDLDILLAGGDLAGFDAMTKLYRNDDGTFVDSGTVDDALVGVSNGSVAWGDYDNDGDLDILITGIGNGFQDHSKLYRNDAGVFVDSGAADDALLGVSYGQGAWGDYDNDGDLDILLTGFQLLASTEIAKLYRNDAGIFVDSGAADDVMNNIAANSAAWGDYDNDGDLDILLTGENDLDDPVTELYRNDAGTFVDSFVSLDDVQYGSVAWGDYDNDGDLDILLTGWWNEFEHFLKLYRNDGGTFSDSGTADDALAPVSESSIAWGDYDNDGDLDILITGNGDGFLAHSKLYQNVECLQLNNYTPVGHGASLTPSISATFNLELAASSVTSSSFVAHAQFTGLLTGTINVSGDTITLDPSRELLAGERVQVIATSAITSPTDNAPLREPSQWGFRAGPVFPRCAGGFTSLGAGGDAIPSASPGANAWGDYDNDGDLDVVITGKLFLPGSVVDTRIFRKDGGIFNELGPEDDQLLGVVRGDVVWGDYDHDGDLDILLTGQLTGTKLYINDAGTFVDSGPVDDAFEDIFTIYGDIAWVDYDNDGDLDISIAGNSNNLYRNDAGTFVDSGQTIAGAFQMEWGDYDNDGDLDILTGGTVNDRPLLYLNDGGTFTEAGLINPSLTGMKVNDILRARWGDYDNDGDLDIVGFRRDLFDEVVLAVSQNNGGSYSTIIDVELQTDDPFIRVMEVEWGDYDNDGDLDILSNGSIPPHGIPFTRVHRNDGGTFSEVLRIGGFGDISWGDFDNDDDLDFLVLGGDHRVYVNNDCVLELESDLTGTDIELTWSAPEPACVYHIYEENAPYLPPTTPTYTNQSSGVLLPKTGDPAQNFYYVVGAVCDGASVISNEVAEFDFAIVPGSP